MDLPVNTRIRLTDFRADDGPALVKHLDTRAIYETTLSPYPFTEVHAQEFLSNAAALAAGNCAAYLAIRDDAAGLIGGVSIVKEQPHRAELGYWLAAEFAGRGIMSAAVACACRHAFEEMAVRKLTAYPFATNAASVRVLEKAGFAREGYLRGHFVRDGRLIDAIAFALFA